MLVDYQLGQGSIVLRVVLKNSSVATGAGLTGLTFSSSGLIIATAADNESSSTAYTQAGSTIETISTLGTYAAPTATKCRFKEFDATNHPGVYEIQIADARFAVSSAKSLLVSINGATNLAQCNVLIPLRSVNPYDGVRFGQTALPNAAANANGGLPVLSSSGTTLAYTVSTLTTYTGNTPQTGDSFARIGATGSGLTSLAPSSTALSTAQWTNSLATNLGTLASHDPGATLASTTNITAGTITTVTNLTNAPTAGDFTATMKTSLNNATPAVTVSDKTGFALTSAYDFAKGTVAMTESYAANTVAPTPAQAFFAIHQHLMGFAISGTSYTVKKLDGSTTAYIATLNDATSPTAETRS